MSFAGINPLSIIVAAVAAWLVGAGWYMALAKPWIAALGKTREEIVGPTGKPSPIPFVISFVAELVIAFVFAALLINLNIAGIGPAIEVGFLAWLGFVLTSMMVNHQFAGVRPLLTAIDAGHWLAVLLIQGVVLGWFHG
jgi:hypothetical protein